MVQEPPPGPPQQPLPEPDTLGAVVVAGLANFGIAVAKLVAGVVSGSAAMLSEAAHSFADTVTEVLLFVAGKRSARPADDDFALGHGRSAFLWALMAAIATFVLGAGFSLTHGIHDMSDPDPPTAVPVSLLVLAVSAVLEGASLHRSRRESRRRAAFWHVSEVDYLRLTSDTSLRAVVLEDVVALVGLALAAGALLLSVATDSGFWDGLGSVLVGLLLLVAAFFLARRNVSLLAGRSAPPALTAAVARLLAAQPGISRVEHVLMEVTGPGQFLVLARVEFDPGLTADQVAGCAELAVTALAARAPVGYAAYIQPVPRRG